MPSFHKFLFWIGIEGLSPEDWQYRVMDDGKQLAPIAYGAARGLAKWLSAHHDATPRAIAYGIAWAERVRPVLNGDAGLWVDWDLVHLYQRAGDPRKATEILARVIKAKKNEFWVWAQAGRLYRDTQPELALACFCRAAECPSKAEYKVKLHLELAQILANEQQYAQASREVTLAEASYSSQGWRLPRELEEMISSPWYDPADTSGSDPVAFYAQHSTAALQLCFDEVVESNATFLGQTHPKDGKKPNALFSVRGADGNFDSLIAPGLRNLPLVAGDPVTAVVGLQNDRRTVVHVTPRLNGLRWDCTSCSSGVLMQAPDSSGAMWVFINRDHDVKAYANQWPIEEPMNPGQGVVVRCTNNPKSGRSEVVSISPGILELGTDVAQMDGEIRRHENGFGFINDAFISPDLLALIEPSVSHAIATAVRTFNKKKSTYTWRVVALIASKPA
jgi:hypothetical protein